MAEDKTPKHLSIKERAELLRQQAARKEELERQQAARKLEIDKHVKAVADDLLSTFSGYLDAYNSDPFIKEATETAAKKPVTPETIFNVMAGDTLKDVLAKIN